MTSEFPFPISFYLKVGARVTSYNRQYNNLNKYTPKQTTLTKFVSFCKQKYFCLGSGNLNGVDLHSTEQTHIHAQKERERFLIINYWHNLHNRFQKNKTATKKKTQQQTIKTKNKTKQNITWTLFREHFHQRRKSDVCGAAGHYPDHYGHTACRRVCLSGSQVAAWQGPSQRIWPSGARRSTASGPPVTANHQTMGSFQLF